VDRYPRAGELPRLDGIIARLLPGETNKERRGLLKVRWSPHEFSNWLSIQSATWLDADIANALVQLVQNGTRVWHSSSNRCGDLTIQSGCLV